MPSNSVASRYSSLSIFLHWLMLALMIAVYATMELKSYTDKGSDLRAALAVWHYTAGVLIFVLVWLCIVARQQKPLRVDHDASPAWQRALARATHLLLYVLMIGMPLLGWLIQSAKGQPVVFFGFELPMLLAKDESLARLFKQLHQAFANFGYGVIALHVAAALFHHWVSRDDTLQRMLPRAARARERAPQA